MSKGKSPSARSMELLRDAGWIVTRVEQRLHMPKSPFPVTKDAFAFGDLLAAHPEQKVIALVQVTSHGNHNARRKKIIEEHVEKAKPCPHCMAPIWKAAGGHIFLQSWAKQGPRGQRKKWQMKEDVL